MDKKKVIERQINKTKGFEGIADYVFAQSNGRIFTRKNGIEKTMHGAPNDAGYLRVTLPGPKRKTIAIHRIIGLIFLEDPADDGVKRTLDHIDQNRMNNHILNLRWATLQEQIENSRQAVKVGLVMEGLDEVVMEYNSMTECAREWGTTMKEVRECLMKGLIFQDVFRVKKIDGRHSKEAQKILDRRGLD